MTIRYECPECDSVLKIRDDKAGKPGRCPKCKTAFVIPEPGDSAGDPVGGEVAGEFASVEDEALAFLMEGGEAPAPIPSASTAIDAADPEEEQAPAPRPSPEERLLHRPPPRQQASQADTSNAAGDILTQSESARAAAAREPVQEVAPRINIDEVKHLALTKLLPTAGTIVGLVLACWLIFNMMSNDPGGPPLAVVTGTVTLDGKPLAMAIVQFEPDLDFRAGEGLALSASTGHTDAQGVYSLNYPGGLEGAVIGTHIVRVNKSHKVTGMEVLPAKYHLKTELKEVVKDGRNTIDLTLKSGSAEPPPTAPRMPQLPGSPSS